MRRSYDDYLDQYGTAGKYLLVVLQVIETISIVIPAMPVYICSGILFGKAVGIAICYTTNLILNILIFLAARKMKYVKSKVLNLSKQKTVRKLWDSAKHVDRVVIVMCFLLIVPNGMIPYLSAQIRKKLIAFFAPKIKKYLEG